MQPADLEDSLLDATHNGAAPIPCEDRTRYFDLIAKWIDQCPLLTPRALADAIRQVQSELLRPARQSSLNASSAGGLDSQVFGVM